MDQLWIQLKRTIILFSIPVLIITGCASDKQQTRIPTEEIQGRANQAFEDLSTHETGQRRPSAVKERRNESLAPQPEVKSKPSAVRTRKGKRPDWVEGERSEYPPWRFKSIFETPDGFPPTASGND